MNRKQLLFPDKINEEAALISTTAKYNNALDYSREMVEKANNSSSFPIRIKNVYNVDTNDIYFNSAGNAVEKTTFHIGNDRDPLFNILFITATHGEESRLWRAGLEAILQLSRGSDAREALLDKGQIEVMQEKLYWIKVRYLLISSVIFTVLTIRVEDIQVAAAYRSTRRSLQVEVTIEIPSDSEIGTVNRDAIPLKLSASSADPIRITTKLYAVHSHGSEIIMKQMKTPSIPAIFSAMGEL